MVTAADPEKPLPLLNVQVDRPIVAGDTVVFSWTMDGENPVQISNSFYLTYEGIDLTRYPVAIFYEIFFAFQLQFFQAMGQAVNLTLADPVWRPGFRFWRTYHSARNVKLLSAGDAESPAADLAELKPKESIRTAVFYGGGKDSTCIASMLGEIVGNDQTLLINFVEPRVTDRTTASIAARRKQLLLDPMAQLGFPTQMVTTDFLAILRPEYQHKLKVHYQFYMAGALPILLGNGIEMATIANERTDYQIQPREGAKPVYRFRRSRPEYLAAINHHFQRLGCRFALNNLNYLFTGLMAAKLLAVRYPDAFARILMCQKSANRNLRWCLDCMKCGNYAFYSLFCGFVDPDFDYSAVFESSTYVRRIKEHNLNNVLTSQHGNALWFHDFCYPDHFEQFCHAIAGIDPAIVADRLSQSAMDNLVLIKQLYGNRAFPESETIYQSGIESLAQITDPEILRGFVRIATEYFNVESEMASAFWLGNDTAQLDFSFSMPAPIPANFYGPVSSSQGVTKVAGELPALPTVGSTPTVS